MTHLGMSVRALRKMRGLTQEQLALMVGLSRTSITNIELGNQILTETTINSIAEALGYKVVVKFQLLKE